MSKWLNDGEVLEGQGSGEAVPVSPRPQSMSAGSPRLARGRSPLSSPTPRKATASPQAATMGKAKQLFVLCDKEGKGFITKRDMQRLQVELPLSPEQLETVFESLDRESNGFLTPLEFSTGLGELMGHNDTTEQSQELPGKDIDQVDWSEDAATIRLTDILNELGADKLSDSQQELCTFWCELQRERPELLRVLEGILLHAVTHLRDSIRERDSLEQALRRRESEHDQVVQSMYEEMENQVREEREKRLAKESIRQKQRGIQVEEELKMRDQELEITLSKQKELESKMQQLICEQANIKEQNQELRSLNVQLQEQAQSSRMQLQAALFQLAQLQLSAAQEQAARQQNMIKVSRNMQKEKDSLLRQLGLLRDMNKRLRDEKDAQLTKNRSPNMEETLQKTGSVVGHYFLQEKPVKRRLSSYDEQEQDTEKIAIDSKASCRVRCERVGQSRLMSPPQHVFKLVFLGSSGVGKSAFIQHYCTGHFCSPRSETAGGAMLAVGVWTLLEKIDYISLLNSSFYTASAYILIAAGAVVIIIGIIGCCASLREMKSLLIVYLVLLLCVFLLEIVAGVLTYITYQELDEELRQNLKVTMQQKYQQAGEESVTHAVDKLHQEFQCCGSNSSSDWKDSVWIQAAQDQQLVPDSCCKTPSSLCGLRDHPSNVYKVEGGCVVKLEEFILSQLYIVGALGIGIAFLQLFGMIFTCCLHQNLKDEPY